MKSFLVLLLGFSMNSFAQDFIQRKDGTKVTVADGSVHNEPERNRIGYLLKDDKKEYHIKYKDLDYASFGESLFKSITIRKKAKGYFVISENNGKMLVADKQMRIKNRGGFESSYKRYEIAVLDKANTILDKLVFTNEKTSKDAEDRSKIVPLIKSHFSDCPKLLQRISLFESPASDVSQSTILVFINDPVNLGCK